MKNGLHHYVITPLCDFYSSFGIFFFSFMYLVYVFSFAAPTGGGTSVKNVTGLPSSDQTLFSPLSAFEQWQYCLFNLKLC